MTCAERKQLEIHLTDILHTCLDTRLSHQDQVGCIEDEVRAVLQLLRASISS